MERNGVVWISFHNLPLYFFPFNDGMKSSKNRKNWTWKIKRNFRCRCCVGSVRAIGQGGQLFMQDEIIFGSKAIHKTFKYIKFLRYNAYNHTSLMNFILSSVIFSLLLQHWYYMLCVSEFPISMNTNFYSNTYLDHFQILNFYVFSHCFL